MSRWDHFDVIIAVGICATILGAGIFFFASGGAPYGLLAQPPLQETLDPQGVLQSSIGNIIVDAGRLQHLDQTRWGPDQERLGEAIVTALRVQQARGALVPGLRAGAQESLQRMHGMVQETAGRSLVQATQRMWRQGNTETAQRQFIDTLGRVRARMILNEQAAIPRSQEVLGWGVVGAVRALDRLAGQSQQRLGVALRDVGVLAAKLETGASFSQESLGSAVLVSALSAPPPGGSPVVTATTAPAGPAAHEIPYQAGIILFATLFVMAWGARTVWESGTRPATSAPSRSFKEDRYRKTG